MRMALKVEALPLCLLTSCFLIIIVIIFRISYGLDSSSDSSLAWPESGLATRDYSDSYGTEGSTGGEFTSGELASEGPEQEAACLEPCNLRERNLSVCTTTTGTLFTHRSNIEAKNITWDRITLEESSTNSQAFKEQGNHFQIIQMSAPHDQLVYIARKGFVDVAATAYNQHTTIWCGAQMTCG